MSVNLSLTEKELSVLDRLLLEARERYSNPAYSVIVGLKDKIDKLEFRKSGYSRLNAFDMFQMEKSRKIAEVREALRDRKINRWEYIRRSKEIEEYYKKED